MNEFDRERKNFLEESIKLIDARNKNFELTFQYKYSKEIRYITLTGDNDKDIKLFIDDVRSSLYILFTPEYNLFSQYNEAKKDPYLTATRRKRFWMVEPPILKIESYKKFIGGNWENIHIYENKTYKDGSGEKVELIFSLIFKSDCIPDFSQPYEHDALEILLRLLLTKCYDEDNRKRLPDYPHDEVVTQVNNFSYPR